MQRLTVPVVFLAFAATLQFSGLAVATDYATNPTPACRTMRNVTPGAPHLPEPNRDDAREAMSLGGAPKSLIDHAPEIRRRFAEAFELMQKIDADGTAALADLPPDTPRIDLMIDRHVANLTWARAMLGVFYEEGRAPRIDYAQAADFYQKAIDTRFVDDRGCVHVWPADTATLTHLAGLAYYGVGGVPQDRARARALLVQAGERGASRLYLLNHDALPDTYNLFLNADMDGLAYNLQHPPPPSTWDEAALLFKRILLGCGLALAVLIAAYVGIRLIRRRRGHQDQTSVYRALFATYDVIHDALARFGLVARGLIECFIGAAMLVGYQISGNLFGVGVGSFLSTGSLDLIFLVSGVLSLFGGIAKLIEAARFSVAPQSAGVHGAARPAAEDEARGAARGEAVASPLRDQIFKE